MREHVGRRRHEEDVVDDAGDVPQFLPVEKHERQIIQ